MDPILERYQALEDKVASYTPNLDTKRLYEAFTYADTEHHGQLRKSGEPDRKSTRLNSSHPK